MYTYRWTGCWSCIGGSCRRWSSWALARTCHPSSLALSRHKKTYIRMVCCNSGCRFLLVDPMTQYPKFKIWCKNPSGIKIWYQLVPKNLGYLGNPLLSPRNCIPLHLPVRGDGATGGLATLDAPISRLCISGAADAAPPPRTLRLAWAPASANGPHLRGSSS